MYFESAGYGDTGIQGNGDTGKRGYRETGNEWDTGKWVGNGK